MNNFIDNLVYMRQVYHEDYSTLTSILCILDKYIIHKYNLRSQASEAFIEARQEKLEIIHFRISFLNFGTSVQKKTSL